MTEISVDLDGLEETKAEFEALIERVETDAVFKVGASAEYAVFLEFGRGPVTPDSADALRFENEEGDVIFRTRVSGHPPYPFFRPALREFEANPESFILDNTGFGSLNDIESGEELVKSVAGALESQIKTNANANRGGRSPGTHPNHPVVQTGNLVASIQAVRIK